jgi:hypothetical protein
MDYLLVIFGVLCAWTVLRVIGGERARRVHDLSLTIEVTAAPAPPALPALPDRNPPPATISHPPVRSKAGR